MSEVTPVRSALRHWFAICRAVLPFGIVLGFQQGQHQKVAAQGSPRITGTIAADLAYALTSQAPKDGLRRYTTQPSRDRQFGLMLGTARVDADASSWHARLAMHTGWFTDANYQGGDRPWRFLQEVSAGARLHEDLWIDAGIIPSHIGYESMMPGANLVLSRSLTADYTPYYETGAMLTWQASDNVQVAALLLNGWQQIVDVNDDLSFGSKVLIKPVPSLSASWSTYVGNDQPIGAPDRLRVHNNAWVEWKPISGLTIVGLADIGLQQRQNHGRDRQWYTGCIMAVDTWSGGTGAARVEHFDDPSRIYISTPADQPAQITGFSLNVDHTFANNVKLRAEVRHLKASAAIFDTRLGLRDSETFVTVSASAALTFLKTKTD